MPLPPDIHTPAALPVHMFVQLLREHVRTLETASIWIEGEITNWSVPASGHAYFTLKDHSGQLRCVMFRGSLQRNPYRPAHGDAVLVQGEIDIYEARGELQLIVRALAPAGAGLLQAQYEALRQKLMAEGLFAPERKRPLPPFPSCIGLVTSATGAALHDMLTVTARRWPLARIRLTPCQVQGAGAVPSIVAALMRQNQAAKPADVVIIGRGGGSQEDLWAFNDESVVRAVAASRIPIVSAVGHETDTTLCDFAADLRAATPSAAAELATPDLPELQLQLAEQVRQQQRSLLRHIHALQSRAQTHSDRLRSPILRLDSYRVRADARYAQIRQLMWRRLGQTAARFDVAAARIAALSPLQVLTRGYCLAQDMDGRTLLRAGQLPRDHSFMLRFADDVVHAQLQVRNQ